MSLWNHASPADAHAVTRRHEAYGRLSAFRNVNQISENLGQENPPIWLCDAAGLVYYSRRPNGTKASACSRDQFWDKR
jgi:hypothetical protein